MTTNVSLAPALILQFLNNAGQMNVGGSLLTQVGGVNYPTFQDAAGATALPNPIPLNSRGEISNSSGVSSQLFLAAGVTYTLTLRDASGNAIWTANNVTAGGTTAVGTMNDEKGSNGQPGFAAANGDFVPGTTTSLTLAGFYGSSSNLWVAFDGTEQGADSYTLNGFVLTFNAPIPVGTSKVFVKGGSTLTIGTPGAGTVTDSSVSNSSALYLRIGEFIDPRDPAYGAKGDGITDDTAAVQAAENAASAAKKPLYFGAWFLINNTGITKQSNSSWIGAGKKVCGLRAKSGAWGNSLVNGANVANVTIRDMGFDFTPASFIPFLRNMYFTTLSNSEIAHCDFLQQAIGFQCDGGSYFNIHHNSFTQSTAYGTTINEACWITANTSSPSNYSFCDNTCVNVGTDFNGNIVTIARNNIQSWAYGAGITTEVNSFGYIIADNYCAGGGPNLDGNGVPPDGIECWSNESVVEGNTVISCAGVGINVGGSNMICDGNVCLNNGTYGGAGNVPSYRAGITLRYLSAQINGNTSIISNNVCVDTGGGTQLWGITDDGANCGGSVISDNLLIGATAPMSVAGIRYDFKGPKLQATFTGQTGITLAAGGIGGGSGGLGMSGAAVGDVVTASVNTNLQGMTVAAWVTVAGTVAYQFRNQTAASITIPNFSVTLLVEKPLNYANY